MVTCHAVHNIMYKEYFLLYQNMLIVSDYQILQIICSTSSTKPQIPRFYISQAD